MIFFIYFIYDFCIFPLIPFCEGYMSSVIWEDTYYHLLSLNFAVIMVAREIIYSRVSPG